MEIGDRCELRLEVCLGHICVMAYPSSGPGNYRLRLSDILYFNADVARTPRMVNSLLRSTTRIPGLKSSLFLIVHDTLS